MVRRRSPRIDHFHKPHSSLKVKAKSRMPLAILAVRAQPNAVRERGFEPIKISANDV